jgi:hypothetical protein
MCVYIFIHVQYSNMYQTLTNTYIHNIQIDSGDGEGARLVRGDAHKQSDVDAAGEKKSIRCIRKVKGRMLPKWHWRMLALRHG